MAQNRYKQRIHSTLIKRNVIKQTDIKIVKKKMDKYIPRM